jgi:hypothetical protein
VSYDLLREETIKKAKSLNNPQSCFKAGKGWAITFMCRMGLALRRRTTICQKKCCISNDLDGSEDVIVWEDNVEDKDASDWVESTDNDSVCTRSPSTSSVLACSLRDKGVSSSNHTVFIICLLINILSEVQHQNLLT